MIDDKTEIEIAELKSQIGFFTQTKPKLTIYILGPGEYNSNSYAKKCYKKRIQIRDFLRDQNHKAYFLEELYLRNNPLVERMDNELRGILSSLEENGVNLDIDLKL